MQTSAIGPVVALDREESEKLAGWFANLAENDHTPFLIEVAVDSDGARFKFDAGTWTPPLGRLVAK